MEVIPVGWEVHWVSNNLTVSENEPEFSLIIYPCRTKCVPNYARAFFFGFTKIIFHFSYVQ